MSIEITGSELVLINLYDTRCAGRGEVSRVGTSHVRSESCFRGLAHWAGQRGSLRLLRLLPLLATRFLLPLLIFDALGAAAVVLSVGP